MHAFFNSPMFLDGVGVDVCIDRRSPLCQDLKTLKAKYDIYIVTSRHLVGLAVCSNFRILKNRPVSG